MDSVVGALGGRIETLGWMLRICRLPTTGVSVQDCFILFPLFLQTKIYWWNWEMHVQVLYRSPPHSASPAFLPMQGSGNARFVVVCGMINVTQIMCFWITIVSIAPILYSCFLDVPPPGERSLAPMRAATGEELLKDSKATCHIAGPSWRKGRKIWCIEKDGYCHRRTFSDVATNTIFQNQGAQHQSMSEE